MPYYEEQNLLYIHVPKTGGESINTYFKRKESSKHAKLYGYYYEEINSGKKIKVQNNRTLQHYTYNELVENRNIFNIDILLKNPTIVVSIRNPYDRIVSELCWSQKININNTSDEIYDIIINYLCIEKDNGVDNHKTPQYNYVLDEFGNMLTNIKMVRTEYLVEDMQMLGYDDFNVHINTNKSITTNSPKINYNTLLNNKSKQIINDYYSKDFEYFGYKKDDINILYKHPSTIYQTTIVSAFVPNINNFRSVGRYIENGNDLLSVPTPKIIFIEKETYNTYYKDKDEIKYYPLTTFIQINPKEDMYLYKFKDKITNFSAISENPNKDTIEYMFVQCNKTEWISQAIELNTYNSNQFIWIDFGISHMMSININSVAFRENIMNMVKQSYNSLRIAGCKLSPTYVPRVDVNTHVCWGFAGSVFGGNVSGLLSFAYLLKKYIIDYIIRTKSIIWEINFWYLLWLQYPELFSNFYNSGHNLKLLSFY